MVDPAFPTAAYGRPLLDLSTATSCELPNGHAPNLPRLVPVGGTPRGRDADCLNDEIDPRDHQHAALVDVQRPMIRMDRE